MGNLYINKEAGQDRDPFWRRWSYGGQHWWQSWADVRELLVCEHDGTSVLETRSYCVRIGL
jgi:hypothetical protein